MKYKKIVLEKLSSKNYYVDSNLSSNQILIQLLCLIDSDTAFFCLSSKINEESECEVSYLYLYLYFFFVNQGNS